MKQNRTARITAQRDSLRHDAESLKAFDFALGDELAALAESLTDDDLLALSMVADVYTDTKPR